MTSVMVGDNSEHVVESMVDLVIEEGIIDDDRQNENLRSPVLSSSSVDENDKKNMPLHFAAMEGDVEKCKEIGGTKTSLIVKRNKAGETPLFLAASHGKRETFLWLHYLYIESFGASSFNNNFAHCCTRDNGDTILHCAIARGYFDVAIEIIHLFEDHIKEMMIRNKEGLSPLHIPAAKRIAFQSSSFHEQLFISQTLYIFFERFSVLCKVKNKATTLEELEKRRWIDNVIKMEETHRWSLQIMNKLLQEASGEDMSQIISRTPTQHLSLSLPNDNNNGRLLVGGDGSSGRSDVGQGTTHDPFSGPQNVDSSRMSSMIKTNSQSSGCLLIEIMVEIASKIASHSLADLYNLKLTSKEMMNITDNNKVYEHANLEKVPFWIFEEIPQEESFLERCRTSGNLEALYRQGMVDYLVESTNNKEGLEMVRKTAQDGYKRSMYSFSMIVLWLRASEDFGTKDVEEALRYLRFLWAQKCFYRTKDEVLPMINARHLEFRGELFKVPRVFLCDNDLCVQVRNEGRAREIEQEGEDNNKEIVCENCKWDYEVEDFYYACEVWDQF